MRVRSGFAKIMISLAVTALLLSGLAYMTLRTVIGSECTAAEEDLIPVPAAQKVLAAHPGDAVARESYTGCFQDDPFPYAGKFYEFPGTREEYASFYETAIRADGWQSVVTEEPSTGICYTKKMVLRAAGGWRIVETKVDYLPRKGRFKATGTLRGTMRAVSDTRRVMASAAHGESASSRG